MSIFFFVSTQAELKLGMPWVTRFSKTGGRPIHLFVVGHEREALLGHARQTVQQRNEVKAVSGVQNDVEVIAKLIRSHHHPTVVMVSDHQDDPFHEQLFLSSPAKTIWILPKGDPPDSSNHVLSIDSSSHREVSSFSESILGFPAGLELIDGSWSSDDAPSTDLQKNMDRILAAERQRCDVADLLCVPYDPKSTGASVWKMALQLMGDATCASTVIFHGGDSATDKLSQKVYWLAARVAEPMSREDRKQLADSLEEGSRPNWEFFGLISASAMLAAFGLLQNSAAVIIGAMLIAPLMTPILGAGLSVVHGNRPLFRASIQSIVLGFLGAIFAGFLFGLLVRLTREVSSTSEMWARCNPSPLDFCVGLVGGIAASYARTRAHLSSALAGAAIAAALVPPLSTAGLQIAFGQWVATDQGSPIVGPLLLVTTNVLTIMIGASLVLSLRGVRSDRGHSSGERWGLRMFVLLSTLACLTLVTLAI